MLTHPGGYASYAVPIRQYRYLQSRLLQCMDRSKPPFGLLMFRDVTPAHKRLSLSGFLFLRTIFTIQGTPKVLLQVWLDVINFGCNSLSATVPADEQNQAKVLIFIF